MTNSSWLVENRLVREEPGFKGTIALINRWCHKIVLTIAQLAEVGMLSILFVTVVMRYCFNAGIGWAEEVPRLMCVLFSFIACAIGVRDNMHISVTVLYSRIKNETVKKVIDYFDLLCTLACGLLLMIYGYSYLMKLMKLPGTLPMTGWPTWIMYVPVPLCGALMTFDCILFLTGLVSRDDLYYSEKDIDYEALVKEREAKEGK